MSIRERYWSYHMIATFSTRLQTNFWFLQTVERHFFREPMQSMKHTRKIIKDLKRQHRLKGKQRGKQRIVVEMIP